MFKRSIAAAGLTALLAAPAFAGSPEPAPADPVVPAPAPAPQWQGGYIGAELGYGNVEASGGGSADGALGGLIVGYDWQNGSTVYGIGFDIDASGIKEAGDEIDHIGRLKGRIGQTVGNGLFYGTAGVTSMQISSGGASSTDSGWFAGLGYETFVSDNVTVGGELLYHDISNFKGVGGGNDIDATTLQVRVAYRF